jgi:hypothetical protein
LPEKSVDRLIHTKEKEFRKYEKERFNCVTKGMLNEVVNTIIEGMGNMATEIRKKCMKMSKKKLIP